VCSVWCFFLFSSFLFWFTIPSLLMESLELVPLLLLHPRASPPLQSIRQPRFPSLLNRKTRNANLRSFSANLQGGGGGATSQGGPFSFEDQTSHHKDDRALLIARETDDFGYLVGFRLLPDSGFIPFLIHFSFH